MALQKYRLRVKPKEDPPEEWSRLLCPFAGHGSIKLLEVFARDCIIEAGPVTIEALIELYGDYIDVLDLSENSEPIEEYEESWWDL
jgi:hypothetical protein